MLFLLFFSFSASAYTDCDCDLIKQGAGWENFNCIKSCNFEEDFNKHQDRFSQQCLSQKIMEKKVHKDQVKGIKLAFVLKNIQKELSQFEAQQEEPLKKKCPNCHFVSQTDTRVQFSSKKRIGTCPADKIKSKNYKVSFKDKKAKNSNSCREGLNKEFHSYINKILLGQNLEGKRLWKECPEGCSFQTYTKSRINIETCEGYLDMRVYCDHQVKKKYNILSRYQAYLQCKEPI